MIKKYNELYILKKKKKKGSNKYELFFYPNKYDWGQSLGFFSSKKNAISFTNEHKRKLNDRL